LIAVQAVRALGVSFILLYFAGRLPAPFAPVAGWGDTVIGVTALPLAYLASRAANTWRGAIWLWNSLGLLDLIVAVGLGAMSAPGPLQLFAGPSDSAIMTTVPWIVIPCFLVPALAFVHLAIFYGWAGSARRRSRPEWLDACGPIRRRGIGPPPRSPRGASGREDAAD
jgi:hypothetical protein